MNNNFVESLISNSGHPRHHEKLIPYQGFIGSWIFDWVGHNEDGSTWTVPGEWHFSWILEGRAIQDNWICPQIDLRSSADYPEGEYGTTIRFYDFKEDCIKIVYIGPILSNLSIFKVSHAEDRIIQDEITIVDKGKISRWEIKDIKENSFKWESYISNDRRKTWRMDQEVYANRELQDGNWIDLIDKALSSSPTGYPVRQLFLKAIIVIEISPMEEGEERQTYELILRVFHECVAPVYSKEGIARFLGMLSPDGLNETSNGGNSFIILAKDQSIIVGMLSVINESHRALVFVGPEHQRKGIGKNLIDNAIKKCLKRNPDLSAITVSDSPNSRSSYEKIDFKAQGDEIDEDGMRFTPMQTST